MMQSTCDLDKHALSAADLESAEKLKQLSAPSQSLLLRLLLRKGPWFRVESLWYEDVVDKEDAVRALHAAGFVRLLAVEPGSSTLGTPLLPSVCCTAMPVSDHHLLILKASMLPFYGLCSASYATCVPPLQLGWFACVGTG